jgi:hypothetical protein
VKYVSDNAKKDEQMAVELEKIGCQGQKVRAFISQARKLSQASVAAVNYLLEVWSYIMSLTHLSSVTAELSYTTTASTSEGGTMLLFPKVNIKISTQDEGEEPHNLQFQIDAAEFEGFVLNMQEILEFVRRESEVLKRELGTRFTDLIGR